MAQKRVATGPQMAGAPGSEGVGESNSISIAAALFSAHGHALIRGAERFIKTKRLNIAAKLAQRVEALRCSRARIPDEVIESLLAGDHDEMGDPASEANPHDHGIAAAEVRIDEGIGG